MQIEIRPADEAWAEAQPLLAPVWTPEKMAMPAWRDIVTADACQRVLIRDADGRLVCHIGIFVRETKWGEQAVRIGGGGGVRTKDGCRRLGFARAGMARTASSMKNELAAANPSASEPSAAPQTSANTSVNRQIPHARWGSELQADWGSLFRAV